MQLEIIIAIIVGGLAGVAVGYYTHGPHKKGDTKDDATKEREYAKQTTPEYNLEEHNTQQSENMEIGKEQILTYIQKHGAITNESVVELLDVSDSTAYRYLEALEQEGKIEQIGETGRGVQYTSTQ